MKSQDVGLLLKLLAMEISEKRTSAEFPFWVDWEPDLDAYAGRQHWEDGPKFDYTARGLEMETGISKTQINLSLHRSLDVGLAFKDRKTGIPRVNAQALFELIVHGIRYVFPARKGELTRGIGTAFSAPMLRGKLLSAGDLDLVWPDAYGKTMGQSVEPLFKTSPHAVKRDPLLYELLALVDAVRLGQPRERKLAITLLEEHMVGKA
ncbi:hypothetical protein E0E54_13940 [Azotobacter chroococcum]|uniref:hypothetical protein n=1 Tax=Azotobacter chroococcum TaxID=353 RepID=UPI00103B3500|nr:hypothetical protein [Azotobacter chroococcum]TBW34558.1 hypothetical protein E0E54_13940 [Azotobacter chroococcum]